jgi:AcrR family transcriptional regulator
MHPRCKLTVMPKLWHETMTAHRRGVRDAVLHTAAGLVAERGLHAVTMSEIAEQAGIGRATLYKYFPDVEAILVAWHDQHVAEHLAHLAAARATVTDPGERLKAVLEAYALHVHARPHGTELASFVHRGEHFARAQRELHGFLRDLVADAAAAGAVRSDVPAEELAGYCLHALAGASVLPSEDAVRRLVRVTLAGLNAEH